MFEILQIKGILNIGEITYIIASEYMHCVSYCATTGL